MARLSVVCLVEFGGQPTEPACQIDGELVPKALPYIGIDNGSGDECFVLSLARGLTIGRCVQTRDQW